VKRFPVIAAGLIMALFAHVARAQSTITILKYDDKGNVVGVIKKTINQKINRKPARQTRSRPSGSSPETSGTAPIDAGAEPREVLISNPPATLLPQLQAEGYQLLERIILNNIDAQFLRLRAPQGITADGAIDAIRQRFPGILIDKNSFFNLSAGKQGGRSGVYANDVTKWGNAPSRCGRGLSIGMIDTAFSPNHPALRGRDIIHRSFVKKKRKPGKSTHGATVAALLVGNPRNGLPGGLLPGATLFAGSIYEDRGDGKLRGNLSSMIKALDWLVEERVSVVNLAMAGSKNKVLAYIIRKASAKGLVLIAAAGNGGPRAKPAFPAANPRVIAVTAIDRQLGVYRYANRGEYIDFAAPGVGLQIATAKPGKLQSGTSFATPFITSVVALHLAQGGRARPGPIRTALRKLAKDLGAPGRDDTFGWGLVQYRPKC
jgi:subtilisin family serine protease